ncbi:hypothetical protein HCZ30_11530 [Marivivens donghaensis]|uniref:Uncharacterized protein n=1 Tax=Marivivens donghaensis TaxID=1699413 RepID=A0ABX0VYJ7_9RHOB|nr:MULTISPECIES: hypothetical protein [Marivivens]NIY73061.1 hypothetical protein [Marivivens donghaensis]
MAERYRSQDGRSETEELIGDVEEAPSKAGREGGNLQRKVGTRDEEKAVEQGRPTTTRVRKSDEIETGNEEK